MSKEKVFEVCLDYEETERLTAFLLRFMSQKWKADNEYFSDFHINMDGPKMTIFKDDFEIGMTTEDADRLFSTIVEEIDHTKLESGQFFLDISIAMGGIYVRCHD